MADGLDFNLIQSSRTDIHRLYSTAASFFEQSDTHHPTSIFDDLWNADFVLAATCVGRRQLSRLEISPYQEALLARGVCRRHRGQAPDGQMEQAMGYTGAIGTMLMDEMAGICGRVEERFTGTWTDIGKVEMELLKAWDWSARAQDQIDGLETHVHRLEASRRAMREDMDEMTRNMNRLLELNRQMIQDILQLRMSVVHNWDNLIELDESSEGDVMDTAPVPVPQPVVHTLVPISELTESREVSEEGEEEEEEEETDTDDKVWEISREEFHGSSPEL